MKFLCHVHMYPENEVYNLYDKMADFKVIHVLCYIK